MKKIYSFWYGISLGLSILLFTSIFSSCISDEAPNSEADITKCIIQPRDSALLMMRQDTTMNIAYSSNGEIIRIYVKDVSKVGKCAPLFEITPGATISPANGSEHDFSNKKEVFYTVTSQDGKWSRTYSVAFVDRKFPKIKSVYDAKTGLYDTKFSLDESELNEDSKPSKNHRYFEIAERDSSGAVYYWASGNAGFLRARGNAQPLEYPTTPADEGHSGKCVKLTTCETGSMGQMIGMPMAAGNLFLGSFDVDMALALKHLEATHFGIPFARIPLKLTGWYKYKAGETLKDKAGNILPGKDNFDIYAVFYKNTKDNGDSFQLDGTNVKDITNAPIIAIAQFPIDKRIETNEWTYFEFPFVFTDRTINPSLLIKYGYSLTVVCSASIDGANFVGAIGSTLFVDDLDVICK